MLLIPHSNTAFKKRKKPDIGIVIGIILQVNGYKYLSKWYEYLNRNVTASFQKLNLEDSDYFHQNIPESDI